MLTISNLRIDPRIEREARALAEGGFRLTIVAPDPRQHSDEPTGVHWGKNIDFRWVRVQAISYAMEWPEFLGRELYNVAIEFAPFAYHAHDIFTAFIGLSAGKHTGAHVVCDFHEWGSENVKWDAQSKKWVPLPPAWKRPVRWLERRCLAEASAVVTVCDSIADGMSSELGKGQRPLVVRNIPPLRLQPTRPYPPLKAQLGLSADTFVLLWQGGTGPTRLIEPIIEALSLMPRCTFVIRGPSLDLFGAGYRDIAERVGAADRLILLPPVPSRDVVAAGRGADAGIWTLPDLCRNFRLALPNKIFEYLASGLPILVANYPEARKIAEGYGVGLTFDPYDPRSIAAAMNRLIDSPETLARMRAAIPAALTNLRVENEWGKLVDLYKSLPPKGGLLESTR
jgi:glycosyltransferase involved in cell wall biosynthesis